MKDTPINIKRRTREKVPVVVVITKNQNENPMDVVNALNLGDDNSI